MSASETLKAAKREKVGTRSAKKLRAAGRIPANIQGEGKDHLDFSVDLDEFLATRRHHVHLYDIDIEGNLESALVRELQYDAFGDNIIHIEFKRVVRGQKTDAEVPIEFVGHPKGGVLNQVLTSVHISCLPSQIPDSLEVKIGELNEGDSIHASDIEMPEGMDLITSGEDLIATISGATVEAPEPTEDGDEIPGEEPGGDAPAPEGDGA